MPQHRLGDVEHVARQLKDDRARRGGVRRKLRRDRRSRRDVGLIEQTHRELGVVALLLRRMRRTQQILVGENAQQRRANIDALAIEIEQAFQARRGGEIYHRASAAHANPSFRAG
jgi:hypothetical protein